MNAREADGEIWMTHSSPDANGSPETSTPVRQGQGQSGAEDALSRAVSASEVAAKPNGGATVLHIAPPEVVLPVDLPNLLRDLENTYIEAALLRTQRNKKEAAKLLGMGRTTLVEKLRRRGRLASGA